jgi:poly(3-hydroxybutyrate) depolymerase
MRGTPLLTALVVASAAGCADGDRSRTSLGPEGRPLDRTGTGDDGAIARPDPGGAAPVGVGCAGDAPRGACDALRARLDGVTAIWADADPEAVLEACAADRADRVGEWRHALIAPLYADELELTADELRRRWTTGALRMTETTRAALAPALGAAGALEIVAAGDRLEPTKQALAIVPADELTTRAKVVRVAGVHPLDDDATGSPLTVPLCLRGPALGLRVANIDPAKLTRIAMTGVTAMTRKLGLLMDAKGATYPVDEVKHWFTDDDFVHVSNEVSFIPDCKVEAGGMSFCSKDAYLDALTAIRTNIVELTGSHLGDKGRKWLARTIDLYAERGWRWFGGGKDQVEATRPLLVTHDGNKIAFLGCNVPRAEQFVIKAQQPDTAFCDFKRLAWEVRDLRHRGYVPIVAVQHWEFSKSVPDDKLVRDFRRLAEAGAAMVFGSQAHHPHGWENHYGAFIHYGAGNFLFYQGALPTLQGAVDRLYIHDGRLLSVDQLFTRIYETGKLRPMTARERASFIGTMDKGIRAIKKPDPWGTPNAEPPPRQRPDSLVVAGKSQPLLVHVPLAAELADSARLPLLVYLHGTIERGEPLDKLREYGVPHVIDEAPDAFPMFAASPQLTDRNGKWAPERVIEVVDYMLAKYPQIDPDRVYLTGFSYGGGGAWRTAVAYPDRFAAVVPIAGYGAPNQACKLKDRPVWAFHGDKDTNVPLAQSQNMVDAIERCGGTQVKLTVYEGVAHQPAWQQAYRDPALIEWLLAQR